MQDRWCFRTRDSSAVGKLRSASHTNRPGTPRNSTSVAKFVQVTEPLTNRNPSRSSCCSILRKVRSGQRTFLEWETFSLNWNQGDCSAGGGTRGPRSCASSRCLSNSPSCSEPTRRLAVENSGPGSCSEKARVTPAAPNAYR